MTASCVPATTRSNLCFEFSLILSISSIDGLRTYESSTKPTLAAPIGPKKGAPESVSAAEAAIIAIISGSFSPS